MILGKMKRETVVDGEGMLNYLKYSHLDSSTVISIKRANKSTLKPLKNKAFQFQFPETQDRATQTINTEEQEVDTYNIQMI